MIYSTTKPNVSDTASKLGLELWTKIEASDAADVTLASIQNSKTRTVGGTSASSSASRPSWMSNSDPVRYRGPAKSKAVGVKMAGMGAAHPVYSLIKSDGTAATKKKIVLPPRGAYGGW